MQSGFESSHFDDADGNPAGGATYGRGFAIAWQNGPLGRGTERQEPNGAFVEDIIAAAVDRLEYYQQSKFVCDYSARAIGCLKAGLEALQERTRDRDTRDVEGTHSR